MSKERPGSVTAASVLCILFGVIGILWGLCGFMGMLFHSAAGGNRIPGYQVIHLSAIVVESITAIALLTAGIGLLGLHRWARTLAIVFAAIGILGFTFQAAYQVAYVLPAVQEALLAAPNRQGAPFDPIGRWFRSIRVEFAMGALSFFIFEILLLAVILMTLLASSARRAFNPEYPPSLQGYDGGNRAWSDDDAKD